MKNALLYVLLIATLLPTVSQWGTIAYYHANKDYIARVLCQNRSKPELNCNGQCYLAKKLKSQQDKQDKETTERVQNSPVLQLFFESNLHFAFSHQDFSIIQSRAFFAYLLIPYWAFLSAIFHPPGSLA